MSKRPVGAQEEEKLYIYTLFFTFRDTVYNLYLTYFVVYLSSDSSLN